MMGKKSKDSKNHRLSSSAVSATDQTGENSQMKTKTVDETGDSCESSSKSMDSSSCLGPRRILRWILICFILFGSGIWLGTHTSQIHSIISELLGSDLSMAFTSFYSTNRSEQNSRTFNDDETNRQLDNVFTKTEAETGTMSDAEPYESGNTSSDSNKPEKEEKSQKPNKMSDAEPYESGNTSSYSNKSEKEEKSQKPNKMYAKADISNPADRRIRQELDRADEAIDSGRGNDAVKLFSSILDRYPQSPRAIYGKARALNLVAEKQQSNAVLEQAIETCIHILNIPDVPKMLLITAGKFCAERQSFRGWHGRAANTLKSILNIYPDEIDVWNDLGVKKLLAGKNEDARNAFQQTLLRDKDNGFAMVHLGFIVKTIDRNYEESIPLMHNGIASNEPGVIDGRFFFHLGDALYRTNRHEEAYKLYALGADKGLFLSMWQRSLYNVDTLTARPWWTLAQTGSEIHFKKVAEHWQVIRDEGLANLNDGGLFLSESEDLSDTGDWKQLTLYQKGKKNAANCKRTPQTCSFFDDFFEATGCTRGQIKFSVMQPGVHVWPHCGPTNCRIRAHLGLVVPEGPRIRVGNDTRGWKQGEFIVFDDSFEHEVWHDGKTLRLVLIVDIWHPELTAHLKATLDPI